MELFTPIKYTLNLHTFINFVYTYRLIILVKNNESDIAGFGKI